MARTHARFTTAMNRDEDWLALTMPQQALYQHLCRAPDLSYAGVLPYLPRRIATFAADATPQLVDDLVRALHEARFLVLDEDTDEVMVRSYIRHDGILGQPNIVKAMLKARALIYSPTLRDTVSSELARAYREDPGLKGWRTIEAVEPDLFAEVAGQAMRAEFAEDHG